MFSDRLGARFRSAWRDFSGGFREAFFSGAVTADEAAQRDVEERELKADTAARLERRTKAMRGAGWFPGDDL